MHQFERLKNAVFEMLSHVAMLIVALLGFRATELAISWIWPGNPKMFFDIVPLKHLFDAGEALMIVVFFGIGTYETIMAYRSKPPGPQGS